MSKLKFAVLGTGFWSLYQIPAWFEVGGVELVAVYNRTVSKAEKVAERFGVPKVFADPEELLQNEELDFIDIITEVPAHAPFVELAAKYKVPVICQKPMAPDYETAQRMVSVCKEAGIPFFIHENYRWEAPIRRYKEVLDAGVIGQPFKARISFLSGFPVFDNQPFLAELEQFILTDMGSHILDVARYLFGECKELWCQILSQTPGIKGEDVATVMMKMKNGMPLYAELSYASIVEHDSFTTVFVLAEGDKGSAYLGPGLEIRTTTRDGTTSEKVTIPSYEWADPDYIVNHESGIPINRNILDDMLGRGKAENTGDDNFRTVQLVWACYESAATGKIIDMDSF